MVSNKWTEAYFSMKSYFGKLDFQDTTTRVKSYFGKLDFQDTTTRVVGPFIVFMGVYTIMSDASNDLLSVAKEQQNHVKEIRKILDPSGYGSAQSAEEVPDVTRLRRAVLWFKEQNPGARALSWLKPTNVSTAEISPKEFVEIIFSSF